MSSATTVVPATVSEPPVAVGAGLTHRGRVRERNEDSILTDPSGRLWAVADGMGGYGHGDIASDVVIDCLELIEDGEAPGSALAHRLEEANRRLRRLAAEPGKGPMGATAVAVIVARGTAHLAWVGDCRAYLWRAGNLRLLSHDHSVVQELIDRGQISPVEAEHHPESHVVTRAVGGDDAIEIEQATVPLRPGDRLLLCSDGLTRAVYEGTMLTILEATPDAAASCEALVREALANGAPDNVSVIVVDIRES